MRVLMVMMVVVMMMMIPMKSSLMVVLMATISPLRDGIPPVEICLPERSFSLSVFRPVEAVESFCGRSSSLRVSGGIYTPEERVRGGPGRPHHSQARPRPARAMGWCGPPVAHLHSIFWHPESSRKIGFSVYFLGFSDFREFCLQTAPFPSES